MSARRWDGHSIYYLYRSTDDGQTWELRGELPDGISWVFASPVPDLVFAGDRRYSEYPLYRSTDGGASWKNVLDVGGYTSDVTCSPAFAQDGTAYATQAGSSYAAQGGHQTTLGVWKTTDWGVTWYPVKDYPSQKVPITEGYTWVEVSPEYPQDQTAFTVDWHGVYQTTNGGASWTRVAGEPDVFLDSGILSPRYPQDQTLLASGGNGTGLWLSQDDGRTWRLVNDCGLVWVFGIRGSGPLTPPPTPTPSPTPGPQRVYLPLGLRNAPLSWQVHLPLVSYTPPLEFWAIYNYHLYRSTDYGVTWELVPVEY